MQIIRNLVIERMDGPDAFGNRVALTIRDYGGTVVSLETASSPAHLDRSALVAMAAWLNAYLHETHERATD